MNTSPSQLTGSSVGGILLVAGCCIGAGMLGLPILSALGGFRPSIFLFTLSWLFMSFTALLLLEVNLWFKEEVSIVSMAERTLGPVGKIVAWSLFLFLFYSLIVAYISGSGQLISDFLQQTLSIGVPSWLGSLVLISIFASFICIGMHVVDLFNRLLMGGLIFTYILLVVLGGMHVNPDLLTRQNWLVAPFAFPLMVISFGFHNLIPSLTSYVNRNAKEMKKIILIGSFLPLLVYVVWEWVILGLIPMGENETFRTVLDSGEMATTALQRAIGHSWVVDIAHYFAFFAIVTSCLGVAMSFVDFLSDALNIKKSFSGKIFLSFVVLFPPWIFACLFPHIFLLALNYAGGFGAVILFGILPAAMVWAGRYIYPIAQSSDFRAAGGKSALVFVMIGSLTIIFLQIVG
ncbi:aromatic amino acid transport family protein [Parachlamydia sp. AcF125]|uniref:amino acid permease n=1 Tax=Parachlamydia sp. AcF125 TaxID=2795736 RepID=UPI001BC93EEE|nr:aromatic amino acid transport family protein [Parachlamydia sp. AcF125]MBS4167829.1 Tyrosine-specific transport protein [Parachlamydia sp. AcF125]